MKFATICSGIGCAEIAADPLGWESVFQSEIDPFAFALLKQRFPLTLDLGDMTKLAARIRDGEIDERLPDVLIAGTPCQSFSISGLGKSLDDPRGQITLELVNCLNAIDERRLSLGLSHCTLLWENVPNVLTKPDNPFGCLTGALVGANEALPPIGPKGKWNRSGLVRGPQRSLSWRILDAQYFGVPQRRRRLFLVAGAGNGFDPSEILFECERLSGNPPPRKKQREDITGTFSARPTAGGGFGTDFECSGGLVPVAYDLNQITSPANRSRPLAGDPCHPLTAIVYGDSTPVAETLSYERSTPVAETLAYGGNNLSGAINVATARTAHPSATGRLDFETETFLVTTVSGDDITHALNTANNGKGSSEDGTGRGVPIIAFDSRQDTVSSTTIFGALSSSSSSPQAQAIATHMQVRRLTVVECERLQGLPDNYTFIRDPRTRKKLQDDEFIYLKSHHPWMTRAEMELHAKDGPRYRAIGNGMAVPVIRWILKQMEKHLESHPHQWT